MSRNKTSITGRDDYIIAQALVYASETIMRLPSESREESNACDMRRILEALVDPTTVSTLTTGAKRHLDGAANTSSQGE